MTQTISLPKRIHTLMSHLLRERKKESKSVNSRYCNLLNYQLHQNNFFPLVALSRIGDINFFQTCKTEMRNSKKLSFNFCEYDALCMTQF